MTFDHQEGVMLDRQIEALVIIGIVVMFGYMVLNLTR